jgi:hypothetical protein
MIIIDGAQMQPVLLTAWWDLGRTIGWSSECLIPAYRKSYRGVDQSYHAVSLHKVSPLFAAAGIDVFRQQAMAVAAGQ